MKKYYFDTIDSTNDEAKRLIKSGTGEDFAVISKSQTSGRGQFERSFFSPPGTGLYLSVALKQKAPLNNSFITQAAAVAVCRSIENIYGICLDIKPVNDLIYGGKKICGILVESAANFGSCEYFAVFGIGINLSKPKCGFPDELRDAAAYLFESDVDPKGLIDEIIAQLIIISDDLSNPNVKLEYERRNIYG
ncbi:MAG: biotin--[acetyl-CoA-carboxylase] ligase [Oscillospiraceae bacterium]